MPPPYYRGPFAPAVGHFRPPTGFRGQLRNRHPPKIPEREITHAHAKLHCRPPLHPAGRAGGVRPRACRRFLRLRGPCPEPGGNPGDNPSAKPINLQASAEHDAVTLTWTASTDQTVTHYAILRRNRDTDALGVFYVIDSNAGPETSYTDRSVAAASSYNYRVKAVSPTGVSQWSGFVKADTPAAPDPTPTPDPTPDPADLRSTGLTVDLVDNKATLSWAAPNEQADSVTGYEILCRRPYQGETTLMTLVADTESTATTYTDATANEAGETYAYQVKAIRGEDLSQRSNRVAVVTEETSSEENTEETPAGTVLRSATMTVGIFNAGSNSIAGYTSLDGELGIITEDSFRFGGVDTEVQTLALQAGELSLVLSPVPDGDYVLRVDEDSFNSTDGTLSTNGMMRSWAVASLAWTEGQEVAVELRGTSDAGQPAPPATSENLAPSNLAFEILEDGGAPTWDAPAADADNVTGYRVLRRRPNQGENEWLVWKWDTGSAETAYKDGYAQTNGEYYMYRVRALRGDEYSRMTNRVEVRRPEAAPQTTAWAPSDLVAQMYAEVVVWGEGVTTQVKLSWDAPAEGVEWIRGYEVQRATCDGGFTTLVADTGSTATAYTDASVTPGETYTYRVRARRPQGLSLWTNRWTVLIPGGDGEGACGIAAGATGTAVASEVSDGVAHSTVVDPNLFDPELFDEETVDETDEDTVLVKNTGQSAHTLGAPLWANTPKRAQAFTTGGADYALGSIGTHFDDITDTSTAGSQLKVTLNEVASNGNPGAALCALSDPTNFTANAVNTFDAPATDPCPALAANTA